MADHIQFGPEDCASYHRGYVALVQDKDLHEFLPFQRQRFISLLDSASDEKEDFAYASGKWTVKQVVQHVNDAERVFAFRLLALCRAEKQAIPGFDQDDYAISVNVSHRTLDDLKREFEGIRNSTIDLFESLTPESLQHRGTVSNDPVLAAALPYILAGHVEHHFNILRDRYGL